MAKVIFPILLGVVIALTVTHCEDIADFFSGKIDETIQWHRN